MSYVLNVFSYGLSLLSPDALNCFAKFLVFVLWDLFRVRRKLILSNLDTAFGDEKSATERMAIGRESVYHFVMTVLEFMSERHGKLGLRVNIAEGEEHLKQALSEGKGAYILCIHMGSWEAMGAGLTRLGYPSYTIVKKVGSASTDRFVSTRRSLNGFYSIQRRKKGDAVKGIARTLQQGKIVGFVMDQARPGEPYIPFFGKPAKSNTSFAAILKKFPAPVLPAFIKRTGVHSHEIYVKTPLELTCMDGSHDEIIKQTAQFNLVVESMIRECPEQYFWMHNRWKA